MTTLEEAKRALEVAKEQVEAARQYGDPLILGEANLRLSGAERRVSMALDYRALREPR